jgi:predicted DNA-binding ribbon-helix-helix protein
MGQVMKSSVVKHSALIAGRRTSISLEDAFWESLKEIARARRETLTQLITAIDADRKHANLSSAIRLFVLGFYRDRGHALPPRIKAAIGRTAHPAAIVGAPWSGLRLTCVERQSDKRDQCNRDGAHGDLLLARRIRPTAICRFAWLRFARPIAAWRVAAGLGFSCFAGLSIHRLVGLSLLIRVGQRLALRLRRLFRLLSDGWAAEQEGQ